MSDQLLTSVEMAHFVTHGFLRFDAIVPEHLNQAVLSEITEDKIAGCRYNNERLSFADYFRSSPAYAAVMELAPVQRLINSLVGRNSAIDHCAVHKVFANSPNGQFWHADATIDPRTEAFDIQIFYYPHDTPLAAGGTLFLPGSQYRFVHESSIARYQNIKGQMHVVCPAGSIFVVHHGLWHCGQPNHTQNHRYMVKLRLNPTVPQVRLFDTADLDDASIPHILSTYQPWPGAEARLEILQRLRLWRALSRTDFDADLWLSRLENQPQAAHELLRT
jgi:hypothetical protein